jgi:fluoroquinolone resistance protein
MTAASPGPGEVVVGGVFEAVVRVDADLTDTRFEDCTITDGAFESTNLRGARLSNCRLVRCRFPHADLRETIFEDCVFADPKTQQGASFAFGRLDEARFARCDLTHARFEGADLYAARFEDCNLLGAGFRRATFQRAFGRSVVRSAVDFLGCNLDLADLAGCDLSRSRFREADLSGADLEGGDSMRNRPVPSGDRRCPPGRSGPAPRRGERLGSAAARRLPERQDHRRPAVPPVGRHGRGRPTRLCTLGPPIEKV